MEKMSYAIQVYLDDGIIFEYNVDSLEKVREHTDAIASNGYRHNDGETFECYPVHRIMKVKCVHTRSDGLQSIPTLYPDRIKGT